MLTAEKVIPVTPEKQEEMSWEPTTEPPVTPEKQEEEVLLWQPYQTPKYWAYHENYTSDWFDELQDETMVEYMFRGHAMKRAPKREYHVPGEVPPVYKWGQQKIHYPRNNVLERYSEINNIKRKLRTPPQRLRHKKLAVRQWTDWTQSPQRRRVRLRHVQSFAIRIHILHV